MHCSRGQFAVFFCFRIVVVNLKCDWASFCGWFMSLSLQMIWAQQEVCRLMWRRRAAVDLHWSSPAVLQTEINQTRSVQSETSPDHCVIDVSDDLLSDSEDAGWSSADAAGVFSGTLCESVWLNAVWSVIVLGSKDGHSTSSASVFMWSDEILPSLSLSLSLSVSVSLGPRLYSSPLCSSRFFSSGSE